MGSHRPAPGSRGRVDQANEGWRGLIFGDRMYFRQMVSYLKATKPRSVRP